MAIYTLENRNGSLVFINKEQAEAWRLNPADAVIDETLKKKLDEQTYGRGFIYSDFTLHFVEN